MSGEGANLYGQTSQKLVTWSFSVVPPTYDNLRAMKLEHDETSMFAQQDGKLFIMVGAVSNTAEYFENDVWTVVRPLPYIRIVMSTGLKRYFPVNITQPIAFLTMKK